MPANLHRIRERLSLFRDERKVRTKGSLCVPLHVTRLAIDGGLPILRSKLRTAQQGQVAGLGWDRIQSILASHGIHRVLAEEGGRTSRGSLGLAEAYVEILSQLHGEGLLGDSASEVHSALAGVEDWWIDRVKEFITGRHLRIALDPSMSVTQIVSEVLAEARKRQRETPGSTIEGAVLQHLVGAKLAIKLGDPAVSHQSYSTADSPTARGGDFDIGETSIHVTTSPTERLMATCGDNIRAGRRPLVVVLDQNMDAADVLAENAGLRDRIDVYSAERFLSANILERAAFGRNEVIAQLRALVDKYNEIVRARESDPSLQIDYR